MLYWYTGSILLCILKENVQKPTRWNTSLFIFLLRWINSNKFELIHLHMNMKSTFTLSINVMLKVTRVLCILISGVVD